MPKKMYLFDKQTQERHSIPEKPHITLGRAYTEIPITQDEEHKIKTESVSRTHCRLIRADLSEKVAEDKQSAKDIFPLGLGVMDLESKNGTYVNGSRVYDIPFPLNDGNTLALSSYEFQIIIENPKPLTETIKPLPTVPLKPTK